MTNAVPLKTPGCYRHAGFRIDAALNNRNEILLLHQYGHPVRMNLWEVPRGLLDITGEDPLPYDPTRTRGRNRQRSSSLAQLDRLLHDSEPLRKQVTCIRTLKTLYEDSEAKPAPVRRGEEAELPTGGFRLNRPYALCSRANYITIWLFRLFLRHIARSGLDKSNCPCGCRDTWDFSPLLGEAPYPTRNFKTRGIIRYGFSAPE